MNKIKGCLAIVALILLLPLGYSADHVAAYLDSLPDDALVEFVLHIPKTLTHQGWAYPQQILALLAGIGGTTAIGMTVNLILKRVYRGEDLDDQLPH